MGITNLLGLERFCHLSSSPVQAYILGTVRTSLTRAKCGFNAPFPDLTSTGVVMDLKESPEEREVEGADGNVGGMHALSRRALLKFGAAAGAGVLLGMSESAISQGATSGVTTSTTRKVERIDIHAHFVPAFYREALVEAGLSKPDGIRAMPDWDADSTLRVMDKLGVATAMLSISSPGVHFGDDAKARALSRRVNEEGRRIVDAHPGRFGFFASLPLPDVDGAIAEAAYAFDALLADGVVFETNQHGVYLGDPMLEPLYAELNRRKAVMFVHPTSPACSCSDRLHQQYPQPMLEFMFETTRSISDMVLAGALERAPDLKVIVPHAGAALPVLLERIELLLPLLGQGKPMPSMRDAMRKLHFDLAGAPVPQLLAALLQVADPKQIHYGSDYPFTPADACDALLKKIETTPLLDSKTREGILRTNSHALFPRLATVPRG
jgi:predicted TIM-barrel fold metal-dependent hydrolase